MDFSGAAETGGSKVGGSTGSRGSDGFGDTAVGATEMGCWPTCCGARAGAPSLPRQVRAAIRLSSASLERIRLSAGLLPLLDLADAATASSTSWSALIALTHPSECKGSVDGAAIALAAKAAVMAIK
jgi:hypothetical protein